MNSLICFTLICVLSIVICLPPITKKFRNEVINKLDSNPQAALESLTKLDLSQVDRKIFCDEVRNIVKVYRAISQPDELQSHLKSISFDFSMHILMKCHEEKYSDVYRQAMNHIAKSSVGETKEKREELFKKLSKVRELQGTERLKTLEDSLVHLHSFAVTAETEAFDLAFKKLDLNEMARALSVMKFKRYTFIKTFIFRFFNACFLMGVPDKYAEFATSIFENETFKNPQCIAYDYYYKGELEKSYNTYLKYAKSRAGNFYGPLRAILQKCLRSLPVDRLPPILDSYLKFMPDDDEQAKLLPIFKCLSVNALSSSPANDLKREVIHKHFIEPFGYERFNKAFESYLCINPANAALEVVEPNVISRAEYAEFLQLSPLKWLDLPIKYIVSSKKEDLNTLVVNFGRGADFFVVGALNQDFRILVNFSKLVRSHFVGTQYEEIDVAAKAVNEMLISDEFEAEPWLLRIFHGKKPKCAKFLKLVDRKFVTTSANFLKLFMYYYCQNDKFEEQKKVLEDVMAQGMAYPAGLAGFAVKIMTELLKYATDFGSQTISPQYIPPIYTIYFAIERQQEVTLNLAPTLNLEVNPSNLIAAIFSIFPNSLLSTYYALRYAKMNYIVDKAIAERVYEIISAQKDTSLNKFHQLIVEMVDIVVEFDNTFAKRFFAVLPDSIIKDTDLMQLLMLSEENEEFVVEEILKSSKLSYKLLALTLKERKEWVANHDQIMVLRSEQMKRLLINEFPDRFKKNEITVAATPDPYYEVQHRLPYKKIRKPFLEVEFKDTNHKTLEAEPEPISIFVHEDLNDNEYFAALRETIMQRINDESSWRTLQSSEESIFYLDSLFVDKVPFRCFFTFEKTDNAAYILVLEKRSHCYSKIALRRAKAIASSLIKV